MNPEQQKDKKEGTIFSEDVLKQLNNLGITPEMVKVLKPGKTAYLAPILIAENYESQRVMKEIIFKAIEKYRLTPEKPIRN